MEITYKRKISSNIFFCVALGFDLLGIVLHIISIVLEKDSISTLASIIVFPLLSLIFWFVYLIEKRSVLTICEDKITFHYHVFTKPKLKYNHKDGLQIFYKDIKCISKDFHPGDKVFTADTNFYNIELNDGTKISFALFHFGRKQEQLIYEEILREFYKYK